MNAIRHDTDVSTSGLVYVDETSFDSLHSLITTLDSYNYTGCECRNYVHIFE